MQLPEVEGQDAAELLGRERPVSDSDSITSAHESATTTFSLCSLFPR